MSSILTNNGAMVALQTLKGVNASLSKTQNEISTGKSVATAGGPSSMMQITPGEIRGQSMAIFSTVIALVGPLLGLPLIGRAIDATGDPKSIGIVLSAYVLIIGIPAIILLCLGLRHYRAAVDDLEQALKA